MSKFNRLWIASFVGAMALVFYPMYELTRLIIVLNIQQGGASTVVSAIELGSMWLGYLLLPVWARIVGSWFYHLAKRR